MYLPQRDRVQKSMGWEHTDSTEKTKFLVERSLKVILTVFYDMKGPIIIDFLEKLPQ